MNQDIRIIVKGREYSIPNTWEALTPKVWLGFVQNLQRVESGLMSIGELRIRLLCDIMGWQWHKMHDETQIANLVVLSERLTFPFRIQYPDDNAALRQLSNQQYAQAIRQEPEHIDAPWADALRTLDWHYQPDLCFFRQLLPTVWIGAVQMFGYKADNHHGALSTSLTALQYIEACEALSEEQPARLAAILYAPEPYNSNQAHALADDFAHLKAVELQAIRMNFQALCTFLFTRTPFSLLTKFEKSDRLKAITTTMADALYDLCADGLGNSSEVEQLNLLTYLRLLRKKTIDSVRQLHGMQMDLAQIANETGLPIETITDIV